MKVTSPSRLALKILVFGLGALAGVQFWLLTGSLWVGVPVGVGAGLFLAWFVRGLGQRAAQRRRVIGEVSEIVEDDFSVPVKAGEIARNKVQEVVKKRPEDVADTIRGLLVRDKPKS